MMLILVVIVFLITEIPLMVITSFPALSIIIIRQWDGWQFCDNHQYHHMPQHCWVSSLGWISFQKVTFNIQQTSFPITRYEVRYHKNFQLDIWWFRGPPSHFSILQCFPFKTHNPYTNLHGIKLKVQISFKYY